ncbi:MAG: copper transport protein [Alphaproteobacteria bacterium]|nr:copper transport protein [Alphaproteobacteria bacterium]
MTAVRGAALLLLLLGALVQAPGAYAHASLVRAEPADGAMLPEPPASLRLTFNEPVSPLVIRLIGPGGDVVTPMVAAENATVTLTPPPLRQGTHVLSWRVISADGHPVGGSLLFSVGAPSAPPSAGTQAVGDPAVRAALWATKLLIYAGLFIGVGGALFRAWLVEPGTPAAVRWLAGALAAGVIATPISVGLQGLDALDLPLMALMRKPVWAAGLSTSYGSTALVALLALVAGLLALAAKSRPLARALSLAGVAAVGIALSLSGHAGTVEPRALTRSAVFLHGVCVALWIGALLPLIAAVAAPRHGAAALARFSRLIPYALAVVVVTGAGLATVQLDRVDALWTTRYGLVLSGKLAVIVALLALAAGNRYVLVPQLALGGDAARLFARSMAAEVALALVIFALVALWRFTPPPRALAAATEHVSIHFHGAQAMAQIEIAPVRARGAEVSVLLLDGELRPLAAKELTLAFSNPAAGIEPVRRNAANIGGNTWRIEDLHIPLAGRWRLRVEILVSDFDKVTMEDQVELPRTP